LSNILLSRLIAYADEIIGDHQCGFQRNRSTTDQIFYIRQILEKRWEYNGTVRHLFIDFKKAYDSVRREALYNILIEFGIPRKLKHGRGEKSVQGFGGKARAKETTWKTKALWEYGVRMYLTERLAWGVWIGFVWLRTGTGGGLL
jgi:hypothetical protein